MSLVLDGSNYLSASIGSLPTATPLTIAYWFKVATLSDAWLVNLSDSSANFVDIVTGPQSAGTAGMFVRNSGSVPKAESVGTYQTDEWAHIAAVVSAIDAKEVSLDGHTGATLSQSAFPAALDTLAVGAIVWSSLTPMFAGRVAEVGVWSRALSADEIHALAAGMRPSGVANGLAGYYPLVGDASPQLGPVLTPTGSPGYSTSDHPLVFEGSARAVQGEATVSGAAAGEAVVGGAVTGTATVSGEVF